ncbi:KGGVGR-motif variant AAA ATPase [Massilia sp.]|uniref:KGGVGR-motif variant AAA ATPase n=1 Tax=Massilia sp. TaxID=1882437 RepID=UPI00352D1369
MAGKVITFYSFKGGVGRTMAMAHVAFLIAAAGKRVLVMDWDLEAPGLSYYYRGLLDPAVVRKIRNTPGILDLLWKWSGTVEQAKHPDQLKKLKEEFEQGEPFSLCVQSLVQCSVSQEFIGPRQNDMVLDFIGAGKSAIETPKLIPYEEALPKFSWAKFFDEHAGGFALEKLGAWARANYDYVFIDSRTGFADVAGVCTLQLPDVVVLCFVLNRQNIEGISKVAGAITEKRGNATDVRIVPMRIKPREAQEESDGRARAIYDLTKFGKLNLSSVQEDFKSLAIATSENVPFYETLSLFDSTNPKYDPLTLQYAKLAAELSGLDIEVPTFSEEFVEQVNRRMQPKNSTIDYLNKLKTADPTRIAAELQRLLDSAFDAEVDGTLSDDYIVALVATVLEASENYEDLGEAERQQLRCLELIRNLYKSYPKIWGQFLIDTIVRVREESYIDSEKDDQLMLELDSLLESIPTFDNSIRRVRMHQAVARRRLAQGNSEEAQFHLDLAREVIDNLHDFNDFPVEQHDELVTVTVDDKITRGDIKHREQDYSGALNEYSEALSSLSSNIVLDRDQKKIDQVRGLLNYRMASFTGELLGPESAAENAVEAARSSMYEAGGIDLVLLIGAITRLKGTRPDLLTKFMQSAFAKGRARRFIAVHARTTKTGIRFIQALRNLAISVYEVRDVVNSLSFLEQIADLVNAYFEQLYRRGENIRKVVYQAVASDLLELTGLIADLGGDTSTYTFLATLQRPGSDEENQSLHNKGGKN